MYMDFQTALFHRFAVLKEEAWCGNVYSAVVGQKCLCEPKNCLLLHNGFIKTGLNLILSILSELKNLLLFSFIIDSEK